MERHKGLRRQGKRVRKARLPEDRLQAGHSQEARRQEGSLPMGHSQEARRQGARLRTDHFQEGPLQAVPLPEVRLREGLRREDRAVPPRDHPAAGFQTALPGFCAICWTSFIWTTWTPETCWFWRCCFSSFERRRTRSCW